MALSSSSSLSSLSSSTFSDDSSATKSPSSPSSPSSTLKFLYSYGGRILPRFPDAFLRYVGGHTRVLSVSRSVPFSDLVTMLGELSGYGDHVTLRCQLPTDDLDALVSVTSDEDLASVVEEYDLVASHPRKIRVFLFPSAAPKTKAPQPHRCHCHHHHHHNRSRLSPPAYLDRFRVAGGCMPPASYGCPQGFRLVHSGRYWQ